MRVAARLRDALFEAVERATKDARTVVVLLGGLDSSAVLSVLTRLRPADSIRAVTVDFPGENRDRPYAEALSKALGVRWSVVEPNDWTPLERFVVLDGLPYGMLYGGGELAGYQRAAELGADLVVTALLGDSIFGGFVGQLGSDLLWRRPRQAVRLALWADLPHEYSKRTRARRFLIGPNFRRLPGMLQASRARRQWRKAMPWATDRFHSLLRPGLDIAWQRYEIPGTPEQAFRHWAASPELGAVVEVCSALSAAAGVRWRDALFDADLVDLLCAVPIETLFDGGSFRGLLRRALADVIPEPALSRQTKADLFAKLDILANPADRSMLLDLVDARELERRAYVRRRDLRQAFERADSHFWIWRFLAGEAFLRQFS